MFRRIFQRNLKVKSDNPILAYRGTMLIKKMFGLVVIQYKMESGVVTYGLSYLGLAFFLFWFAVFSFCVFFAYVKDQTILRKLFDTRLRQYGDEYERIATLVYILFTLWKLPFDLYRDTTLVKCTMEIDKAIESLGGTVDYSEKSVFAFLCSLSQVAVYLARTLCICITLHNLDMDVPYERLLQVVFCDALALIFSGHYCYYLFLLIDRYAKLNKFLSDVKTRQAWEYTIFIRDKPNIEKANLLQEKYICKKIQMCANLYCMQYNAANQVCKKYGFGLVLTTTLAVNNIILYLFYFMEATASGLFHDLKRYIYFLFYVFWQTAYSTGIIFMAVYFSEKAVAKATDAIYITHNIINSNPSPAITKEAKRLSLQFLHLKLTFAPCGLYKLDYEFCLQMGRSVITFLVILLQFVMEK